MKKIFFLFLLLIINSSLLISIEVGGHLTEDTTWSSDNNPYLVTSVLYVDDDVTLFIEPGTEIFINSALFNNDTMVQDFAFHVGEEPTAKMFWVNGRIIAEGTEQDSILFTRIQQDSTYFKWGIIHLSAQAELSRFKHCRFEHAAKIIINLTFQPMGAIAVQNSVIIDSCYFIDNRYGIKVYYPVVDVKIEVTNNFFTIDEGIDPNTTDWGRAIHIHTPYEHPNRIWIANNEFHNRSSSFGESISIVNNKFYGSGFGLDSNLLSNYVYGNYFYNAENPISASANEDEAGIYIKKNIIEADSTFYCEGIRLNNYGYFEVSDNIVNGSIKTTTLYSSGKIYNNVTRNGMYGLYVASFFDVYNNICYNNDYGMRLGFRTKTLNNNIIIDNQAALYSLACFELGIPFSNTFFLGNDEICGSTFYDTLRINNCIIDSISDDYIISGENNLLINENQIDSIFVDFANNDFHLIEGSLAIDAGFDTLGYYYPFDMDYNLRVWDGDNNGSAIIDIGPYEYGAPQFGKIIGNITETESGEPVDYVLLLIDNEPGNFTFADSAGYFEIQLPAGTYDIYAERVFYEDNIIYSVTVVDELTTEIEFNITSTLPQVSVEDDNIQSSPATDGFKLSNYPNPFNPSTTITFSLTQNSDFVNLIVYNIKGQKVKTLINEEMQSGKHTSIWSGLDSNNKPVSSGIYLYKIKVGKIETVNRMLLLK